MTTVAFRVDADERIGLGHAMRCLALADALRARGAKTAFAVAALPERTTASLRARGHAVFAMANAEAALRGDPERGLDAAGQRADAIAAQRALASYGTLDWMVVDHYGLGLEWERAAAGFARRIAVVDDHARRAHDCDLLIDQNVGAGRQHDDELLPARAMRLLGPRYALLRSEFARAGGAALPPRTALKRLLVAFGGADPTGETEKVLRAIAAPALRGLAVDVVAGAANPRLAAVRELAERHGAAHLHVDTERMGELMERADLAIGAAGVSALERCAKGLPSLLVSVADNQRPVAEALAERGAAIYLGSAAAVDEALIAQAVGGLAAMPDLLQRMAARAAETCDGHGARRVATRMLSFDLKLRPAEPSDSERVLAWRNDERTRRYSLNATPIDPARHAVWFSERLNDERGALLIGEDERGPVGVLRYDVQGATARVSVYLVPDRHGEGLGALLLHAGHRWLMQHRPTVRAVDADVLADNHGSRLAFAEAGYAVRQLTLQRRLPPQE